MQINPFAPLPAFTKGSEAKAYLEGLKLAPELVGRIDDMRQSLSQLDGMDGLDYDPRPEQVVFVDYGLQLDGQERPMTGEVQKDEQTGESQFSATSADQAYQYTYSESQGSKYYECWTPDGNMQVSIEAGSDQWNFSRQAP